MDDQKSFFSKNLQYFMSVRRKSQIDLVEATGFDKSTVSLWYNGQRYPKPESMKRIADFLHISVSDLLSDPSSRSETKATRINVYGSVAAGIPLEMIEDIEGWEDIDEHTASTGKFFGLKIKGNSMEPRICDGDVVIVRQQDDAESGDTVIVTVNGDTATCKRIRKYRDGIELIPNNPAYEPMFYNEEEIENLPVKVIGKVIELRGKV